MHHVNWVEVCKPKMEGGFGINHITKWNPASCGARLWELASHTPSMWADWIKKRYLRKATVEDLDHIALQCSYSRYILVSLLKALLIRNSHIVSSTTTVKWVPLDPLWVKANSDGSLSEERGGYGALLRDDKGEFLMGVAGQVYPCPKGSVRHREVVRCIGGKDQFPFLVDPNTGISMYESGDIVKYLFQQYAHGKNPSTGLLESTLFTGWMPTILRVGRGMSLWERAPVEPPLQKLELFSVENNPFARIVREALCEFELPYILYNVGEGSSKTESLLQLSGSRKVPYLIDPNTETQLGDYKKILSYLFETYSASNKMPS
ncbi:hypothetical protein QJS10_CPB13g01112 [Acorus calamus]|uniref:GST N-terminal domain-containing protein n=1 Tax=Acorus calamus TaxID=4465 RepID=A0AAV9DFR4_ACOCL|nr:hypothetical protein QJS10_CPB13g01112 [Acorus calamus]